MAAIFACCAWMLLVGVRASATPRLPESGDAQGALCASVRVRQEYRDYGGWGEFAQALLTLQTLPSITGEANQTEWDSWTNMHSNYMMIAHDTDLFFPWHRAYVLSLERRLNEIQPGVSIPFWDWTADWQAPISSPIFSPAYGLDVRAGSAGDCRYQRTIYKSHCLTRDYDAANFTAVYYAPELVQQMLAQSNYTIFRQQVEAGPHAIVHTSLGGPTGDMSFMNSPNDPIFFLHHSMIDALWWSWQKSNKNTLDLGTLLSPFNLTVGQVLDASTQCCYTYEPYSANKKLAL